MKGHWVGALVVIVAIMVNNNLFSGEATGSAPPEQLNADSASRPSFANHPVSNSSRTADAMAGSPAAMANASARSKSTNDDEDLPYPVGPEVESSRGGVAIRHSPIRTVTVARGREA